jgi:hypothetical protein
MIVFDTETRTDAMQCLTFGSYRCIINGRCLEEGLFHGDDLTAKELRTLRRYVRKHEPDVVKDGVRELRLLTLRELLKELYLNIYKARDLFVAFNHPFDLSRIAHVYGAARGRYTGGFSFGLWTYVDKNGRERRNAHRPRVIIKHIDSKRALIGFTARKNPDREDLIPDESRTGKPKKGYKFRGNFLDLRTLAFALTDRGHSLDSACQTFGVEHGKQKAARHGTITAKYIDYNRRDVLATAELAIKLRQEYDKHRISLQVTKAFSPASIGKGYLRDMGIEPVLQRQADFPKRYIGYAQSAFYGGRTSAHIRKVAVPVVYTDFLSMYPTVNSLMRLWDFVKAREIKVHRRCKREIQSFLRRLSPADLFKPATWQRMPAFVRIIPDDDILPSRSKYSLESKDWQVALNHLSAVSENPKDALWYSLPDVAASVLLTGHIPNIVDAFRVEPLGVLKKLTPIKLYGAVKVDPGTQDFFRVVIEQRKLLSSRTDLTETERKRLDKALKVLANAASYGIYAEMNRQESDEKVAVTCYGIDPKPYCPRVAHPEAPGEYCFPPLASLITGAARLMLALLEHSVTRRLGGTYAMEDTDSMAIVATPGGGIIPCEGGSQRTQDGREAVKALSWKQVEGISKRFAALNPYNRRAIPGSILKIEEDNYDPKTGKQRQLYCFAISAKRYALFLKDRNGAPNLLREGENNPDDRWSEHGLGHLSNPTDLESEDRDWISKAWLNIVRRALGFRPERLGFEHLPAVGRMSISSPAVMKPLAGLNLGKKYPQQIKPFNFLVTCHVKQLGHPPGTDPEHFHLIAPYETNPRKWLKTTWINQYTGDTFRITTAGYHGSRWSARVKTYGEVLEEYEFHPESKCADKMGNPCDKQTIGLLNRRRIRVGTIKFIGKESNSLEDVEGGLVQSAQNVYTEYPDPSRDEWDTVIRPALKIPPLKRLVKLTGFSRRMLIDARAGRSRPHRKNRELLALLLHRAGLI